MTKITQGPIFNPKPANSIKHIDPKSTQPKEGTFSKLVKTNVDLKALDSALRASLKIANKPNETEGTHQLPVKLEKTKLWSAFGLRKHPRTGKLKFHNGVDLGGKKGLPVGASSDGTVILVHKDPKKSDMGKHVRILHGDGTISTYAHLSKLGNLKTGQKIKAGHIVGKVGNTGGAVGVHLHFELARKATAADKDLPKNPRGEVVLDPLQYFPKQAVAALKPDYDRLQEQIIAMNR